MDENIVTLDDYCYVYQRLDNEAQKLLSNVEKMLSADNNAFRNISLSKDESSITFLSCGFRIKIAFIINTSAETGCINWHHIYFDEEAQKSRGKLIRQQFFDYRGHIYKDKSKNATLFGGMRGFERYFQKTLLEIFRKIDSKNS